MKLPVAKLVANLLIDSKNKNAIDVYGRRSAFAPAVLA